MSQKEINKRPSSLGSLKIEGEASEQRWKKLYRIWKEQIILTRLDVKSKNDAPSGAVMF